MTGLAVRLGLLVRPIGRRRSRGRAASSAGLASVALPRATRLPMPTALATRRARPSRAPTSATTCATTWTTGRSGALRPTSRKLQHSGSFRDRGRLSFLGLSATNPNLRTPEPSNPGTSEPRNLGTTMALPKPLAMRRSPSYLLLSRNRSSVPVRHPCTVFEFPSSCWPGRCCRRADPARVGRARGAGRQTDRRAVSEARHARRAGVGGRGRPHRLDRLRGRQAQRLHRRRPAHAPVRVTSFTKDDGMDTTDLQSRLTA